MTTGASNGRGWREVLWCSAVPMAMPIIVGVLVAGPASGPVEASDEPSGYVKIVAGSAFIDRHDGEYPAHAGDAVFQHDRLRTGTDGRLGVTLKDETRVSLGPNTEIDLAEFSFSPAEGQLKLVVKLLRGVVAFVTGRIDKLQPDAVRIETPAAIVGVRGTHLVIRTQGP